MFKPERWMKKDSETREVLTTHACIPFGLGIRSCIGRGVAELQMQLLLSRVRQMHQHETLKSSCILNYYYYFLLQFIGCTKV